MSVSKAGDGRDRMPAPLMRRLVAGEHPLRIWREQRKLSLAQLARMAGVPAISIGEIEAGKKAGAAATMRVLAAALSLDIEAIKPAKKRVASGRTCQSAARYAAGASQGLSYQGGSSST